jgi:hypothetical protein
MLTTALVTTLASALTLGPLPALAQSTPAAAAVVPAQWAQGRAVPRDRFQQVYAQGYQMGRREAERDARFGRGGDYRRSNEYRSGGRWGNSRSGEADAFRRGFAEGYTQTFRSSGRGRGNVYPGYPGPRQGYPGYPGGGYPSYPGQGLPGGSYGGGYGYGQSPAAQRGFDEGYREGLDAGRRNNRYDPVGERRYRSGDAGYNSRYGSREQYKHEYRNAFRQGYDRGYREARYR